MKELKESLAKLPQVKLLKLDAQSAKEPTAYARFLSDSGNPDKDAVNKRDAAAIIKIFLENL